MLWCGLVLWLVLLHSLQELLGVARGVVPGEGEAGEREKESRVGEREEGREGVKWYITTSDVPGLIIVLSCYLVLAFNLDCFVWNDTFSC